MIGFPSWTLWGMAFSVLAALLALLVAFVGQSPRLMRRLGLDVYRLDLRVRAMTGYAFAFLLLTAGFFLAGVPLDAEPARDSGETEASSEGASSPVTVEGSSPVQLMTPVLTETVSTTVVPEPTVATPASGAFFGFSSSTITRTVEGTAVVPNISSPTIEGEVSATGTPTRVLSPTPTFTQTPSPTPTASSTPTSTPTPTASPTPTITPTPIDAPTATVDSNGSSIWVLRSPGGQQLTIVEDGATLILLSRHANQGGVLWREIMTVEGLAGWIQERYLSYTEDG